MEGLLGDGQKDDMDVQQARDYIWELDKMYQRYEYLLKVSIQITAYEVLYSEVRVQFLGRKLKALKKGICAFFNPFDF